MEVSDYCAVSPADRPAFGGRLWGCTDNLMNVSRISYRIKNKKQPTDEEIWAE